MQPEQPPGLIFNTVTLAESGDDRPISENEAWYDREISADLVRLGKLCKERGMPFVAVVEFEPGNRASVVSVNPDPAVGGVAMNLLCSAVAAGGNFDAMAINFIRWCNDQKVRMDASLMLRKINRDDGEVKNGTTRMDGHDAAKDSSRSPHRFCR